MNKLNAFKKRILVPVSLAFCLAAASGIADASTLLTSNAGYTGPTLQLGAYANGSYNFQFGPVALPGGMTWTRGPGPSNSGLGGVIGQGYYGLGANGSFDRSPVYTGLDGHNGDMTFALSAPVMELGFFFNYDPGSGNDPTIVALDHFGNPIAGDTFDLATMAPISTPGATDAFEFRGILDESADIWGLRASNSYILATGSANGNVVGGVPEPQAYALMLAGLAAWAFVARRKATSLK